ncbi:MAG: alpha/beta fold hydrolase [Ardenticatenaceae bacterium]
MKALNLLDGPLYYDESGNGPALLLLHAGVADSRMWDAQVAPLAEQFQVIRCDLRGHGRSPLPDGLFAYHDDVRLLLDALASERVWLVGASFGARVAVDLCLAYPERVKGMILVSAAISGWEPSGEVELFSEQEDALLGAGKLAEAVQLNVEMWVDGPYRSSDGVDPALRSKVAEMQARNFAQPFPPNVALRALDPPAIERLMEIRVPLLVVSGALDVAAFRELSETIAAQVPNARHVVIPKAAHLPSMEAPALFNELVAEFISAHEQRSFA